MATPRRCLLSLDCLEDRTVPSAGLVSINLAGTDTGNGESLASSLVFGPPQVSADGRVVAFVSRANNLTSLPDTNFSGTGFSFFARDLQTGVTKHVDVDPTNTQGGFPGITGGSHALSPNGRYVAYSSVNLDMTGLVDNGGSGRIFLRDLQTATTTLVSNAAGGGGLAPSMSFSADSRFLAFTTQVAMPGFTANNYQLYVFDTVTSSVKLASAKPGTPTVSSDKSVVAGNQFILSADGSRIAFASTATDLTSTPDTNGTDTADVFVRNLLTDTTTLVTINSGGTATGNSSSLQGFGSLEFSADGRFLLFNSEATDLLTTSVPGLTRHLYLRDLQNNTTRIVSQNANGDFGGDCRGDISADGRYVVFQAGTPNLVSGAIGSSLYRLDLQTNQLIVVNVKPDGTPSTTGDGTAAWINFSNPTQRGVSEDGRYVVFRSAATDLVTGVTNPANAYQVYVRDLLAGVTTLMSNSSAGPTDGATGFGAVDGVSISADGTRVAFIVAFDTTNLTATDTNGATDVFANSVPIIADTTGAKITDGGFGGAVANTFDAVVVTFNEAIDPATFAVSDVVITGPNGTIPVTGVTLDAGTNGTRFSIGFEPQTTPGGYTVTIGPDVRDLAGNQMDQNQNGTNGEASADRFNATGTLGTPQVPPLFAVGASDGSVRILNASTGATLGTFRPLDVGTTQYTGIVQVAVGDLNGDGVPDLFVSAANPLGAGGLDASKAGHVFVFDGLAAIQNATPTLIHDFVPFATSSGSSGPYINGLNIATGDVNGDGRVDLIAGTRGKAATAGNPEAGRVVAINGTSAPGNEVVIGGIISPFSSAYQKGCVIATGDFNGDGKAEIAITRGGPVASSNPNKSIKLKAFTFNGSALTELNLSGTGAPFAPFPTIERDGRVTFVDSDGDGKQELVFSALDRTNTSNTQVRIALFAVNVTSGLATLVSTGTGADPATYLVGNQIRDHAIAPVDLNGDGASDLALITESATSQIQYLDPVTGDVRVGGFSLTVLTGGITIDGI